MSATLPGAAGSGSLPAQAEPAVTFAKPPGKVELHLPTIAALFDPTASPSYPHAGPMLEKGVAKFLLDSVRERPAGKEVELVLRADSPPLSPEGEGVVRTQLSRYFANEAEVAALEARVNREEGLGSLRYAIPLVAVALLVAGFFYLQGASTTGESYLLALSYLVFITIVWVMLWDPLEVLLFDSFFLRRRVRALHTLASARVTFVYSPADGKLRR